MEDYDDTADALSEIEAFVNQTDSEQVSFDEYAISRIKSVLEDYNLQPIFDFRRVVNAPPTNVEKEQMRSFLIKNYSNGFSEQEALEKLSQRVVIETSLLEDVQYLLCAKRELEKSEDAAHNWFDNEKAKVLLNGWLILAKISHRHGSDL